MTGQRGLVLLPVMLALAIVGAVAYAMTRDGAMTVTAIDAQYEIDKARYLAEAGVNLLKWRNDVATCGNVVGFNGPVTALDGGTITASGLSYKKGKGLALTVTATTPRGTVNTIVLDQDHGIPVYDLTKKTEITISQQGGSDTFIRNTPALITTNTYLETTDGNAHGLIKFGIAPVPPTSLVVEGTLRIYLGSIQSVQAGSLGVYRLLRAWTLTSGWTAGWTNPGGDFAAQPSGTIPNILAINTWYTARIDGLVQSWAANAPQNLGLLLKPTGLLTARFNSFEATNGPQLFVRYYPLCN